MSIGTFSAASSAACVWWRPCGWTRFSIQVWRAELPVPRLEDHVRGLGVPGVHRRAAMFRFLAARNKALPPVSQPGGPNRPCIGPRGLPPPIRPMSPAPQAPRLRPSVPPTCVPHSGGLRRQHGRGVLLHHFQPQNRQTFRKMEQRHRCLLSRYPSIPSSGVALDASRHKRHTTASACRNGLECDDRGSLVRRHVARDRRDASTRLTGRVDADMRPPEIAEWPACA